MSERKVTSIYPCHSVSRNTGVFILYDENGEEIKILTDAEWRQVYGNKSPKQVIEEAKCQTLN